jgi:hypothetical protein
MRKPGRRPGRSCQIPSTNYQTKDEIYRTTFPRRRNKKICDPLPNRSKVIAGGNHAWRDKARISVILEWPVKKPPVMALLLFIALGAGSSVSKLLAAQKAEEPDTLMLFAKQAEDPVHIVQASFAADNSLVDALLENTSHQKIQSYRLSWVVVKKDDVRLAHGISVDVPTNVDTSASFTIPGPENAAKDDVAKHPNGIVFYISELQFRDGKTWQAESKKIRKEAVDMLK